MTSLTRGPWRTRCRRHHDQDLPALACAFRDTLPGLKPHSFSGLLPSYRSLFLARARDIYA